MSEESDRCEASGKVPYLSSHAAYKAARKIARQIKKLMRADHCPDCGHWHLANVTDANRKAKGRRPHPEYDRHDRAWRVEGEL